MNPATEPLTPGMLRLLAALIGILEGILQTLADNLPGSDKLRLQLQRTIAHFHEMIARNEALAEQQALVANTEPHGPVTPAALRWPRPGNPHPPSHRPASPRPASGPTDRPPPSGRLTAAAATGPPGSPAGRRCAALQTCAYFVTTSERTDSMQPAEASS